MTHHTSLRVHATRTTTRTTSRTTSLIATLTAALLALLVLALPGTAQAAGAAAGVPPGKAWVRFGHFVPGMGAASIDLEPLDGPGAPITLSPGATYGEVSAYQKLAPGTYAATVRDTTAPAGQGPVLSRSFEVTSGEARTVAVLGTSDQPRLALLTDDLTTPQPGTARVRLLSASADAGAVTVKAVGGPTLAEQAVLGETTDYTSVPAGLWALTLESASNGTTSRSVSISAGSIYTVVALDGNGQDVRVEVVTDAAGAVVAPVGGAATGGGGTAVQPGSPAGVPAVTGLALLVALLGTALAVVHRRRRGTP